MRPTKKNSFSNPLPNKTYCTPVFSGEETLDGSRTAAGCNRREKRGQRLPQQLLHASFTGTPSQSRGHSFSYSRLAAQATTTVPTARNVFVRLTTSRPGLGAAAAAVVSVVVLATSGGLELKICYRQRRHHELDGDSIISG